MNDGLEFREPKVLVITGEHGESWRCQAVTARGRRCCKDAVIQGLHPLRKVPMALCVQHGAIAQRPGTELRLNSAAGYNQQVLPVYGGTFDGKTEGITVPYDLRPSMQWMIAPEGGQLEVYEMRAATMTRAAHLQYIGPAAPSSAPGAPESGDVPSQ